MKVNSLHKVANSGGTSPGFCAIIIPMDIGAFLSYRRKQLGLSLSDVGGVIGYTPQAVYRYEKGAVKINLSLVESFCTVLNLSLESFFRMDPNRIESYQGEKFVQENFCSLLRQTLDDDPSLEAKISSELLVSTTRIENWANGASLPSVDEFLSLSNVLGYDPVDLYLGQAKKKEIIVPRAKRKAPLLVGACVLALWVCITTALCLSPLFQFYGPDEQPNTSQASSPFIPAKEKCSVIVRGYDVEDDSPIESIHYQYQVEKGDTLKQFETASPYYDYLYSRLDGKPFSCADTPIESDVTIQAFFSKKTFTVTFLGYHEEVLGVSKTRYLSDAIPPASIEDQGDFRFVGWKEDFTRVCNDLTVHSIFSRFRCNLILDFEGGESDGKTSGEILGYSAESFSSLPNPQKKGHQFKGYADQNGNPFNESYPIAEETITVHAVYEPLTYQIHFEGMDQTQSVTYGTEVTSLPLSGIKDDIILGWKRDNESIALPFVYEDDSDITLTPILASSYFSYTLESGEITLNSLKQWNEPSIDLSALGPYPISKISSHALSGNTSIESITLSQSKVELESSCFENLPSLKKAYFDNVDSESLFQEGIFSNCPNLNYLRSGVPLKEDLTPYKLKDYGVQGGESFVFEFNESTKSFPSAWNDDFGVLGELRMGNGIQGDPVIRSNGCQILRFVPGRVGYSMITLELPDLNQDELRFYGTSLVKIEGEKFGKVRRFAMSSGGVSVSNRSKPLEVEEFDMSAGVIVALREQTIKANRILLSDCAEEGYFAPLHDQLQVEFYGCSSIPDDLTAHGAFLDGKNTQLAFHPEKLYNDDIVEYPTTLFDW